MCQAKSNRHLSMPRPQTIHPFKIQEDGDQTKSDKVYRTQLTITLQKHVMSLVIRISGQKQASSYATIGIRF